MEKKNRYINYIISNGVNIQPNQPVEISCSIYIKEFGEELKKACLDKGASFVYMSYYDSNEELNKIHEGYSKYVDEKIKYYQGLIDAGSCRISLKSPYVPRQSISEEALNEYRNNQKKLRFISDYFYNLNATHTICVVPNPYWAQFINMPLELLWDEVYNMTFSENNAEEFRYYLNKLNIKELLFDDGASTKLSVRLTNNFKFVGPTLETKDGIVYEPNIPSREVYTAPLKFGLNGYVYSNRNIDDYKHFGYYRMVFDSGKIIEHENLDNFLFAEEMYYCGEIALVEYSGDTFFRTNLLDENMACHLGLGDSYPYGIVEFDKVNHFTKHYDIVFGTATMDVKAICDKGEIYIMRSGKFVYED